MNDEVLEPKKYYLIDHTADVGLHVLGDDAGTLFKNAAQAMFEQIADIRGHAEPQIITIEVRGVDWPDLMVNWLRELLYYWTVKELLLKNAKIVAISKTDLISEVELEPYRPDLHALNRDIKAVTYHQIMVREKATGWEAKIIFDV